MTIAPPRFGRMAPSNQFMKTKWWVAILVLAATLARAQTNNLTSLLQQGLFAEQADRNLDAAIADYQTLARQYDRDRQLAATAVFRLGECYRMQGKTNEAALEYQRILHDFSDQQILVTMSRQNLAGLGASAETAATTENAEVKLWNRLQHLNHDEIEKVLPTIVNDSVFMNLSQQRDEIQTRLAELQTEYAPTNLEVQRQKAGLDELNRQLDDRVNGILQGLKMRAELSQDTASAGPQPDEEDQEIQRVRQMIQNSPDLINAPGENGFPPLIQAANSDHLRVAQFLLANHADVNVRMNGGATPLIRAAASGHKAMVELLLKNGADLAAGEADNNGYTALHFAAARGYKTVVETLLASRAEVNAVDLSGQTPLILAAQKGDTNIVQILLAAGADPNLKTISGETALSLAARVASGMVSMLLAAGAHPNTENSEGRTPLSYAAERDSPEMVQMLLAARADPNGGRCNAPLLCAIYRKDTNLAASLLLAGARPNAKGDVAGSISSAVSVTPLFLAVALAQPAMVRLLLEHHANPNDSQADHQSLLFSALRDTNSLELLLDAGADVDPVNADEHQWTPLGAAANDDNAAAVEILLKHGANPNADTNIRNRTRPLHFAAYRPAGTHVFELLLAYKADPNVRSSNGQTPLDVIKTWLKAPDKSPEVETLAGQVANLLRRHGALDDPPDLTRIKVSRSRANFLETVFEKNTNDWNHFTLLELVCEIYPGGGYAPPRFNYGGLGNMGSPLPFPDLTRIVIHRPGAGGMPAKQIQVNLLEATNGVDGSQDLPLEFGDTIEIPEREHALSEAPVWLTGEQYQSIRDYLRSRAGAVKLIVDGGQTIQVPLAGFAPIKPQVEEVLYGHEAQSALTSDSDFSHVKVTRMDPKTGARQDWIINCPIRFSGYQAYLPGPFGLANNLPVSSDLWLREGDVIEVPAKP